MSMKSTTVIISIFLFAGVPTVFAANSSTGGQSSGSQQQVAVSNQGTTTQVQSQTQVQIQTIVSSPTGMAVSNQGTTQMQSGGSEAGVQVQNQNEVQTQNQGEEQSLQVANQEQEVEGMGNGMMGNIPGSSGSQDARMMIDSATEKLDSILMVPMMTGSPGEKIQTIVLAQSVAQKSIKTELLKIETRQGFMKALIGPDYQALKNMQKLMAQNQVRVRELEQLKNEVANQRDAMMIEEAIQALTDQNTSLQQTMGTEEKANSAFGWFFKLFVR